MSLSKMADTRVSKGHYSASLRLKTEIYRKKIFLLNFSIFREFYTSGGKSDTMLDFLNFRRKIGR